jgi:DNA mismatch repair protein MutL
MGQIKILPEILSNKIAAGEVVERPASVVKELLENSIDAKSTRIVIDIEQGGKSLIRISDNGIGMKSDDALLAIERYATSKIYDDKDLFSIRTLGFRGEALPSIASVSKFTLISKDEESETGTKLFISGGVIKNVEETGTSVGSTISVSSLFFNTPARRKFMKTVNTEMGHIGDVVSQTALGWPNIQFRLTHNGRVVKNWARTDSFFNRAVDIVGSDLKEDLLSISYRDSYFSFEGFISRPKVFRSTSKKIHLFVNGRCIKDRGISHAIFEGYRGRLVKGRFPISVLYITIDFDQVDVNVHPAKDEVRFSDQRRVYNTIKAEVEKTLGDIEKKRTSREISNFNNKVEPLKDLTADSNGIFPISNEIEKNPKGHESVGVKFAEPDSSFLKIQEDEDLWSLQKTSDSEDNVEDEDFSLKNEENNLSPSDLPNKGEGNFPDTHKQETNTLFETSFFSEMRVCGQLFNTYILCEYQSDLILIDQHAAHERIIFEEIKELIASSRGEVQRLLLPDTVELSFKEATELEYFIPDLLKAGFEIEPFGGNTYVIKTVPSILSDCDAGKIIREISEKAVSKDYSKRVSELLDESLILMACHGAIRARQQLEISEMENILIRLDSCENSYHCPHGRPTWIKYSEFEIKKAFGRIV